jgi:hypothetical protein
MATKKLRPPSAIFRGAAELIAETGWTQHREAADAAGIGLGWWRLEAARFCALGACYRTAGLSTFLLNEYIRDHAPFDVHAVWREFPGFNDFVADSQADVEMALLMLAEWAEGEGA